MLRDAKWQIGQRIMTGFAGTTVPDSLRQAVKEYQIGNFILFARNVESREQLHALCAELQSLAMTYTGVPALIAIDQEGGTVSRVSEDCANVPTAMALAATQNARNAFDAGVITGRELSAMGVNFDLAPVMDVNSNPRNPVIGARSYGDSPDVVSEFGTAMIRGLREGGVLSCAKHFPGHGDTAVDSHLGLPRVEKTLSELEACELIPFRAAVEAGVDAIMTTHILFPEIEKGGVPATMSRTILHDVLRERLGFTGLIVTDCLMMNAIKTYYGTVPGARAACDAGADIVCISHDHVLAGEACEEILLHGDAAQTAESVRRIMALKETLAQRPVPPLSEVGCEAHRAATRRMREASVCRLGAALPPLGEHPFFVGCGPFASSQAVSEGVASFPEWMRGRFGGTSLLTGSNPDEAEIARAVEAAANASCVALCTLNAHMKPGQAALVRALAETGKPLVVCALRDPYDLADLPPRACGLLTFEYAPDSLAVLADVLAGRLTPTGRVPCTF